MKILTAAEIPLAYLTPHIDLFDYEFCLAHLMDPVDHPGHYNPQYEQFYIEQNAKGRITILDNGAFELPAPVSVECLLRVYEKFPNKANVYLVAPDVRNDAIRTLMQGDEFLSQMPANAKIMTVAQGTTLEDYVMCYKHFADDVRVNIIGTTYDYPFYADLVKTKGISKTRTQMWGRIYLFQQLDALGVLRKDKWHHLLGCSDPFELTWQKRLVSTNGLVIKSVDTSFPYAQAYGDKIVHHLGLNANEEKLIRNVDYFTAPFNPLVERVARENVVRINEWATL